MAGTTLLVLFALLLYLQRSAAERARFLMADPDSIPANAQLMHYGVERGRRVYTAHCEVCHGPQLHGDPSVGVPNLTDGDWLYGSGRIGELEHTVLYGIRSGHPKAWNLASMPAFATANPYPRYKMDPLSPQEIGDLVSYLRAFQHPVTAPGAEADAVASGARLFHQKGVCFDCHGGDARGDPAIGAPDLTDNIWLYGDGSAQSIRDSIAHGLSGSCPEFAGRLSARDIRAVAVYVYASETQPAAPTLASASGIGSHE
jgi:cytochrome c oxidase cbb3-type subunit 3